MEDWTEKNRKLRMLAVIDEYTRESLAIEVAWSFTSRQVIEVSQYLFAVRGTPEHLRSDNGPEFVAKAVTRWLSRAGVKTVFIAKGSTWENGYVESFNSRFRDELLNREHFVGLEDARWLVDRWRLDYNHQRAHSSLGYQTPAEFAAALLTQILLFRLVHRRGEGHTETVLVKALPNWWTDLDRDRIGHNWNAVLEMK